MKVLTFLYAFWFSYIRVTFNLDQCKYNLILMSLESHMRKHVDDSVSNLMKIDQKNS